MEAINSTFSKGSIKKYKNKGNKEIMSLPRIIRLIGVERYFNAIRGKIHADANRKSTGTNQWLITIDRLADNYEPYGL